MVMKEDVIDDDSIADDDGGDDSADDECYISIRHAIYRQKHYPAARLFS